MANMFNDYFLALEKRIASCISPPYSHQHPVICQADQITLPYYMKLFPLKLRN